MHPFPVLLNYELSKPGGYGMAYCAPAAQVNMNRLFWLKGTQQDPPDTTTVWLQLVNGF